MAESGDKSWWRNLLVIPLIVGALLAALSFVLPLLFKDQRELSYSSEGPIRYLKDLPATDVSIEIKGVRVSEIYGYRARVWNSGNLPIKQVPVQLVFTPEDPSFRILQVNHATKPLKEFAKIVESSDSAYSRRYTFEYLNPNNEDIISILTNKPLSLNVYSNPEGIAVKLVPGELQASAAHWFPLFSAIAGALGALLGEILVAHATRRKTRS